MKGQKNVYVCDHCHRKIVTVDVDHGVTPFMLRCKEAGGECVGTCYSSFYRVDQEQAASFEWYAPTAEEVEALDDFATTQHVSLGGLLLRPVKAGGDVPKQE